MQEQHTLLQDACINVQSILDARTRRHSARQAANGFAISSFALTVLDLGGMTLFETLVVCHDWRTKSLHAKTKSVYARLSPLPQNEAEVISG